MIHHLLRSVIWTTTRLIIIIVKKAWEGNRTRKKWAHNWLLFFLIEQDSLDRMRERDEGGQKRWCSIRKAAQRFWLLQTTRLQTLKFANRELQTSSPRHRQYLCSHGDVARPMSSDSPVLSESAAFCSKQPWHRVNSFFMSNEWIFFLLQEMVILLVFFTFEEGSMKAT